MTRITARRRVIRLTVGEPPVTREDLLAVEEPLEIRVGGRALAVTMRTPGHDFDLAAGFLVSEGVITRGEQLNTVRYCAGATEEGLNTYNVLDVTLAPGVAPPDPSLERSFYTSSSCGLCGKASIDAVPGTDQNELTLFPALKHPHTHGRTRSQPPWLVRINYRMRTLSFGMAFVAAALHIHQKNYILAANRTPLMASKILFVGSPKEVAEVEGEASTPELPTL